MTTGAPFMPFFLPPGLRRPTAIQPTRPSTVCEIDTSDWSAESVQASWPTVSGTNQCSQARPAGGTFSPDQRTPRSLPPRSIRWPRRRRDPSPWSVAAVRRRGPSPRSVAADDPRRRPRRVQGPRRRRDPSKANPRGAPAFVDEVDDALARLGGGRGGRLVRVVADFLVRGRDARERRGLVRVGRAPVRRNPLVLAFERTTPSFQRRENERSSHSARPRHCG